MRCKSGVKAEKTFHRKANSCLEMEGEMHIMATATYTEKIIVELSRRSRQGRPLVGGRMIREQSKCVPLPSEVHCTRGDRRYGHGHVVCCADDDGTGVCIK